MVRRAADDTIRALLEYLSPQDETENKRYFGKGTSGGQALASACMEFVERASAKMRPEDYLLEAGYAEIASDACNPCLFSLSPEAAFVPAKKIEWVWGYSLTRSQPVLVPANLVFFPYEADQNEKIISWTDSNGLASGNNLEEAMLHGILEVVERDAAVISEYNRLPQAEIRTEGFPVEVLHLLERLAAREYACSFRAVPTDIPIPTVAAYLQKEKEPAKCCVAFGCHLDPSLAVSRALTEAVQLLPPSINQEEWYRAGSAERYADAPSRKIPFDDMKNLASSDLKDNIEMCVALLKGIGSEVIPGKARPARRAPRSSRCQDLAALWLQVGIHNNSSTLTTKLLCIRIISLTLRALYSHCSLSLLSNRIIICERSVKLNIDYCSFVTRFA